MCLEVSVGTWEPDPFLDHFFLIGNDVFLYLKKLAQNVSGPHVPSETSRHRPPTALKLGSDDSQLRGAYALEVWWRLVSCEARTCGSGEVLCAKNTFFLV